MSRRLRITVSISDDEATGLTWVGDSFEEHQREGLGTGDDGDNRRARQAIRWIGRVQVAYHKAVAREPTDECKACVTRQRSGLDGRCPACAAEHTRDERAQRSKGGSRG